MAQDTAHKQNIEWLKEQLAQQESELAKAEALVVQLRASVAHFRGVLEIMSDEAKLAPTKAVPETEAAILNGTQVVSNVLAEDETGNIQTKPNFVFEEYESFEDDQGNAQDMKRPEYLGRTFAEAAQMVLDKHQNSQELKKILSRVRHSPL